MADIKAKKVIFKNRDGEHLIPYVGDSVIDHRITNCLLEVPQRIKLEYENNVSGTLKAGSQVIIPSGFEEDGITPKFIYKEIEEDLTFTLTSTYQTDKEGCLWVKNKNVVGNVNKFSGDTAPAFTGASLWYDTANNIIKNSTDSGATWQTGDFSLPFAKINTNTQGMQINQVFNGMGYIGSTIWADKGVKGLIPNGRNEDGTLENIEITTDSIKTQTFNIGRTNTWFCILSNKTLNLLTNAFYDEKDNYIKQNNVIKYYLPFATGSTDSTGRITEFNTKQTFRAVDYNDKAQITGWSMPSAKFVDLELGSSGSKYTAPANGWFYLNKTTQDGGYIALDNTTCNFRSFITSSSSSTHNISTYIPAKKGDVIAPTYNATGATIAFRFIYAEGEV